ncbi:MAG: methyl-accepting chemotaxis protein [Peptococcaceae bacterium]|nr:methyl-accepting chemotaxis protein [Peptococcaceae bacterium]
MDKPANEDRQLSNDILECVLKSAPYFQKAVPLDNMIGVSDTEKFLGFFPGQKINMPFDVVGVPLPPGDAVTEAVRTGMPAAFTVPPETFGFRFKAVGIPITDAKGQVIGALGMGISLENQTVLEEAAESFSATSQEITATTQELTANMTQLAAELTQVTDLGENVIQSLNKTEGILKFINHVAANSNLLGINASIEAARAGQHGRGFNVVADEIRKMATESAASVKEIKGLLDAIRAESLRMIAKLTEATKSGEQQVVASQQIAAAMAQLASSAENIQQVAHLL